MYLYVLFYIYNAYTFACCSNIFTVSIVYTTTTNILYIIKKYGVLTVLVFKYNIDINVDAIMSIFLKSAFAFQYIIHSYN